MEERVKVEKGEGGKQDKKILERVNHGGKYGKAWAATDMRFFSSFGERTNKCKQIAKATQATKQSRCVFSYTI